MAVHNVVRDYFDREADRFDAIYAADKSFLHRVIDSFRKVVVERLQLMCTLAPLPTPWSVLDVGCGSGRYVIAFARLGARYAVGLDISSAMTDLAQTEAGAAGVNDHCRFETVEFLEYTADERFDVITAMGYFDYVADPVPHLRKMVQLSRGRVFLSLPKRWELRVPIRKLRFALQRGFVRFYSAGDLQRLMRAAAISADRFSVIDFGRDWIVVVRVAP